MILILALMIIIISFVAIGFLCHRADNKMAYDPFCPECGTLMIPVLSGGYEVIEQCPECGYRESPVSIADRCAIKEKR